MSVIVRHLFTIYFYVLLMNSIYLYCMLYFPCNNRHTLALQKPSENREINRVPSSTTSILRVRPMQQQPSPALRRYRATPQTNNKLARSNNELQNTHTGNKRHPEMKPNLAKTASSFCLLRVLVCIATRLACARACSCPQYLHIQPHTLTQTQLLPGRPESGSR